MTKDKHNGDNLILIGMPGSGKSTLGVLLAKIANYDFLDGDLLIQRQEGKKLYEIINEKGVDGFLSIENRVLSEVNVEHTVIATGGSAIFGQDAMEHLKASGTVIYLDVSCEEIIRRVNNVQTRGIAMEPGTTMEDVYRERVPYYEKYADVTIACDGKTTEQCAQEIVTKVLK